MNWFGETWDAPLCDPATRVETPVGVRCGHCEERIEARDRGVIIPHLDTESASKKPYHFECHIRLVIGSVAHQQKRCSCFGSTEHDPPGMTLQEAAGAALRYFLQHPLGQWSEN